MSQRFKSIRGCKPCSTPRPTFGTFGRVGGSRGFRSKAADLRVSWGKEKGNSRDRIHVTISEDVANRYGFKAGMPVDMMFQLIKGYQTIVFTIRRVSDEEGVRLCNLSSGNKQAGLRTTFRAERNDAANLFNKVSSYACTVCEESRESHDWPEGYCEFIFEQEEEAWTRT